MRTVRTPAEQHQVEVVAMRYWLLGQGFHVAAAAFEFARDLHVGLRKDGRNPKFSHPLFVATYLRTLLPGLMSPEATLAVAFLHDVCEDYGITFEEVERRFGPEVATGVRLMTKKYQGVVIPPAVYYGRMEESAVASIVKPSDRGHNVLTMPGTDWTLEKQVEYVDDIDLWFLPMLKRARRNFPRQEPAYENVKMNLVVQSAHIRIGLDRAYALRDREPEREPPPVAMAMA